MEETAKKEEAHAASASTTTEQQAAPQPQVAMPSKKKNMLLPVIVGVAVLVLGAAAYFFLLDNPGKVKEKVKVSHPLFLSYNRSVEKMADHLKEDAQSDSDAIERYGAKGEDILSGAKKDKEELVKEMQQMSSGKLQKYKDVLQAYLDKSSDLVKLEENNVKFSKAFVEPLRKYEKLSIEVSGASNYLYSDPEKYVTILKKAISDEQSVIKDLDKVDLEGDMGRMHDVFIETLKTEVTFLEDMVKAVENRDSSSIASATQRYTQTQQNNSKELKRVSDKLDSSVDKISDNLTTLKDKVEDVYNDLKEEYKL